MLSPAATSAGTARAERDAGLYLATSDGQLGEASYEHPFGDSQRAAATKRRNQIAALGERADRLRTSIDGGWESLRAKRVRDDLYHLDRFRALYEPSVLEFNRLASNAREQAAVGVTPFVRSRPREVITFGGPGDTHFVDRGDADGVLSQLRSSAADLARQVRTNSDLTITMSVRSVPEGMWFTLSAAAGSETLRRCTNAEALTIYRGEYRFKFESANAVACAHDVNTLVENVREIRCEVHEVSGCVCYDLPGL
jgi:hypothetical protein